MGTHAHVVVHARDPATARVLVGSALARLDRLEQRWSRFRDDSEISALNRADGRATSVSDDTRLLVDRSVEGWERTAGRFDPTVLAALLAAGYDRDFHAGLDRERPVRSPRPAPGCGDIRIRGREVTLPAGVAIDPGGIGKGLAVDLVIDLLMTAGATGALVNVGGDLRVAGRPGPDASWSIELEHPRADLPPLGRLALTDRALASTWRTRRRWRAGGAEQHHVVDPRTGRPAWTGLAGVSVLAATTWWAEVLGTEAFVAGAAESVELARRRRTDAVLVRDDGAVRTVGRLRLRPAGATA
jgi:thiamine biosynthesis lipoprotein